MPIYTYTCEDGHKFDQFWATHAEAEIHIHSSPCSTEECKLMASRSYAGDAPTARFVGFFPGQRIKEVDARKRRQSARVEAKIRDGEMTAEDAHKMAQIRDKYGKASPYMTDVKKLKEGQSEAEKQKREENNKPFHHELEM